MSISIVTSARGRFLVDVLSIGRPWIWPVSLVPFYVGFVLASHRLLPDAAELPSLALAALVTGPLMWLAVCAVNDACDTAGDRGNRRKAGAPVASGRVAPATALRVAVVAGLGAVAAALAVRPVFALGTVASLLLGWVYSSPPLRLKCRPGWDVAVNALAVGAFGPLAGWTALRGLDGYPWPIALQGTLVAAALYLPTTLADLDADRAAGYRTTAVRLGARRTLALGRLAWSLAAVLSVALAAADVVIPRNLLPLQVAMVPALVLAYVRLVGHEQSFRGIAYVGGLFMIPSVAFALSYTGTW